MDKKLPEQTELFNMTSFEEVEVPYEERLDVAIVTIRDIICNTLSDIVSNKDITENELSRAIEHSTHAMRGLSDMKVSTQNLINSRNRMDKGKEND